MSKNSGFKRGEVVSFITAAPGAGKSHFADQALGRAHRRDTDNVIRTGFQSLDYECAGGGHIILLIGQAGSGKTAILNKMKSAARIRGERVDECEIIDNTSFFNELGRVGRNKSTLKLIDMAHCPYKHGSFSSFMNAFRQSLYNQGACAVIAVQAQREGLGRKNMIERSPSMELVRMADYVFGVSKSKVHDGVSTVVNIKNRYRGEARRTACFPIHFKQKYLTNTDSATSIVAEEINWPLPK